MSSSSSTVSNRLLEGLMRTQTEAARLLHPTAEQQRAAGYFHTLHEICQQPETWLDTASRMLAQTGAIRSVLEDATAIVLTGSGSSEYAGECVRLALQHDLGVDCQTLGGGAILTHGVTALPKSRPGVMVSLARSGDSPESAAALRLVRSQDPSVRHLVLTCNEKGRLALEHDTHAVVLDSRTNDRSLVMTSSFTNLCLAARFLGFAGGAQPEAFGDLSARLAACAETLLETHFDAIAKVARSGFRRAVFLGSGERYGAAREASLKLLEMTAGRVPTMAETFLGLRHGPMAYVLGDTLLVCFLATGETLRRYEYDLISELNRKEIGVAKLLIGENIPTDLIRPSDVAIEIPGLSAIGDGSSAILHVVVGQLLAFFRCMAEGFEPDSPSKDGVINRVVKGFEIHSPTAS